MRICLCAASAALLALPLTVQGRVIWADAYAAAAADPSLRYTGKSGNDYVISEIDGAGAAFTEVSVDAKGSFEGTGPRSQALELIDNSLSHPVSVTVGMDRFDPFDTAGGENIFSFQFDFGVHSFDGTAGMRFILKPDNASTSNLIIGFGAANILPTSGTELFFYAANGGTADQVTPSAGNAIGLNSAGSAFEEWFNFGVKGASETNDTRALSEPYNLVNLYRFAVSFDGTTYDGTVTRLDWNGTETTATADFSISVPPVTLSSSDAADRFIVTSNNSDTALAAFDNFEFSVTPEPSGAILLLPLTAAALRRRRGCMRRG